MEGLFSTDEFNYCLNGQQEERYLDIVNDLNSINIGSPMGEIISLAHDKPE